MSVNSHALVKLTNGEELITKVLNDDGSHYTFEDPVLMYRTMAPDGQTWIQCSHWLLFNRASTVRIHKDHVIALVNDLHENVSTNYENFLKGGYTEMEHRDEVEHQTWIGKKYEEAEDKMKEALLNKMVGGANTTVH
jgi:hypothetical protein